jgi:hypothetical protein
MKVLFVPVLLVFAIGLTASPAFADYPEAILKRSEANLKITLNGRHEALKESAILAILDIKSMYPECRLDGTIIPLMRILRTHTNANMRVLAALALYEVGDDRALYAIKEAARFDTSQLVRHICLSIQAEAGQL